MNPSPKTSPSLPKNALLRTWSLWSVLATILMTLLIILGLPDSWAITIQNMTGWMVVFFSHLCGLSADYDSVTHEYQVSGFRMRLIFECTAFTYLLILFSFILCTPKRPWLDKGQGFLFCGFTLLFFNLLRLTGLGLIGTYAPNWFDLIHDYFWKIGTAILTISLWILWYEKGARIGRWLLWCVIASFGAMALLTFFRLGILNIVTSTADRIFILVSPDFVWSHKLYLLKTFDQFVIRAAENRVVFHFPWKAYSLQIWADVLNLSLFAGLVFGTAFTSMIAKQKLNLRRLLIGFTAGIFLLLAIQILVLVIFAFLAKQGSTMALGQTFLVAESLIVLILPVLMSYFLFKKSDI